MFDSDDDDSCYNADDEMPLFQVIEAVQHLINEGEFMIGDEWIQSFLRRVERTVRGMSDKIENVYEPEDDDFLKEQYFTKPWKYYTDESQFILTEWELLQNDDDKMILKRHANVKKYEKELERRKNEFELMYGRRKTFHALCKNHHSLLTEYLVKCISFHSSIPVQGYSADDEYWENVNYVDEKETEEVFQQNSTLRTIEIPLQPSVSRLYGALLLSSTTDEQKKTMAPFIPSQSEKFLKTGTMSGQEVADFLGSCRWALILGDPGCGKTTLLRWIILQLARLIVRSDETLLDVGRQLNKWQRLAIRFGVAKTFRTNFCIRLPILIRTSELISWLYLHPNSTIMDYIGHQTWFTVPYVKGEYSSFLREFIHHGHAFLLFDGLDEVSNYDERKKIVDLIEEFTEKYIRTPVHISMNDEREVIDEWGGLRCEWPKYVGGNQVIIASRIIGYYLYPVKSTMYTLFTLDAMNEKESHAFINHWLLHIPYSSNRNMPSKMGRKSDKIIRKKKEMQIKELLYRENENFLSHPMLLSLILPILYRTTLEVIELKTRLHLYDMTVQYALHASIPTYESNLGNETIYWLLYDMAFHIHTHCPSGLLDTFDLTHLFYISLRELCKHKGICKSNEWLKDHAKDFVFMLTNNSIGFVVARGLDAYGFSHLIFQEYFVALSIVKPYIADNGFVLDRLLAQTTKPRFREPLILAMEWISLNWKSDDFDRFCLELSEKVIGPFPIGALFLSSVLGNISNAPELHILSRLFTVLVASSTDKKCFDYLADGLGRANALSILIEHLVHENTNITGLCRFFVLSLEKDKHGTFRMPSWLSKDHFLRFEASADTSENLETTIDSIFHYLCNTTWSERFQLSNRLIDSLVASKSNIYPTMLSLLIVLCGGLHHYEDVFLLEEYTPKPIQFDVSRMHRSTPLSDLLLTYFTDDQIRNSNRRFEHLIEQCHKIILTASIDDVSRRVVDAFIALICLRGLSEPSFYEHLLHYHALPRALYRMRLALYQMRQFYRVKTSFLLRRESLPSCAEQSKLEGCQILEKFLMDPEVNVSMVTSFSIAMCAAFSRLFLHAFSVNVSWDQPLPIVLAENKTFLRNPLSCSVQVLRLILNPYSKDAVDDAAKWSDKLHPFQIYYNHPLFPIAFISSKLQPLFQRLISSKQLTNKETIPFAVVLVEVLLSVDEIFRRSCCEQTLKALLILRVLENDIRQDQLDSYSQAIIHDIKTEANCNDWHFSDCDRGVKPAQSESALKLALNIEHERIHVESNLQLFTASIGLVRVVKSLNNTYDDSLEEVKVAALSIRDPVLRILCLRHIREIVRSCVDTKYYYTVQNEIVDALESISVDDKPLVVLALVLGACAEEQLHPSMQRLLNFIWERLQCEPTCDEERLDQEAIFQTIRHIIGHSRIPIPLPFLVHSAPLQLNSPIFHTIFQNMTFNFSETTLLAQLYIAEVTIDAQILTQFSQETGSLSTRLTPFCAKNILKHSWKPRFEKFSHRQVILINSLVLSPPVELEDIPFSELRDCTGFEEERDRPVIESWLDYCDDERCAQIAILAVFLLVRAQKDMTPQIHSKTEMIFIKGFSSKIDSIRRGVRACFALSNRMSRQMCYWGWSTPIWHLLRNLMISSLGVRFAPFSMDAVRRMKNLLEAERQRLSAHHVDDPYFQFSLLSLIDETFENDGSDIQIHLSEILVFGDYMQDLYLASVIFHIVRKCKQKEWCDKLFELLHNLLYNTNLPSAQLAAIYALASQNRGREILLAALIAHFDPYDSQTSDEQKYLSEPELVACMIALTNSHDEMSNIKSLSRSLWHLWHSVNTESVRVQHHIQACLLSHLRKENDRHLSVLQSSFNLTYREVYSLYIMNTSYFVLEWRERIHWIWETAKFIVSHIHEVLAQFVTDLYVCLTAENKINGFQNPEPNHLAIARKLAKDNSDLFCQAIRISDFGEEKFKNALYLFNKRGITVDQKDMCLELYASFQVLTEQFIEMVFGLCLEDFSIYQFDVTLWYEKITIADREDIEMIFPYIESPSMYQRRLAVNWLLRLVELDILSIHEVQQLLSKKDVWEIANEKDEFCQTSEWYRLLCLKPLYDREYFPTLSADEIEADFSEVAVAPYLQFT